MADDQALQGQLPHLANGGRGRSQLLPYQPHGFTVYVKNRREFEMFFFPRTWYINRDPSSTPLGGGQFVILPFPFCFAVFGGFQDSQTL